MNNDRKALEFEALICEAQAVALRTEGMKTENKERELRGESLAYNEYYFYEAADAMREIAKKFRDLK